MCFRHFHELSETPTLRYRLGGFIPTYKTMIWHLRFHAEFTLQIGVARIENTFKFICD